VVTGTTLRQQVRESARPGRGHARRAHEAPSVIDVRAARLPTAHRSTRTLLPRFAREILLDRKREKILVAHRRQERGHCNGLATHDVPELPPSISCLVHVDVSLGPR
jgi:hypothetical protein